MFVLIHELKKRGNNVITLNTTAYKENKNKEDLDKVQVTLIRNFGHEQLIDDLSYVEQGYCPLSLKLIERAGEGGDHRLRDGPGRTAGSDERNP